MSPAATATRQKTGGRKAGTPNRTKVAAAGTPNCELAQNRKLPFREQPDIATKLPPYRLVAVADLVPYINNPMEHPPDQIDLICKLITEFGWTNPVLIDGKRGIIAGHGRVLAAQKLGMAMVPTIELRHLNDAQKRAYVMADNESARKGRWNDELRGLELGELRDLGFDLSLTGFDMPEIGRLLGPADGNTDPDDAPAVQAVAVSRVGDVWILGRHRLTCGDCTDAAVVEAALAGAKPHLMVTDAPYGVDYDAGWRDAAAKHSPSMGNRKDTAKGRVQNDDRADWTEAWTLFLGDVAYVWCASLCSDVSIQSLEDAGLERRAQIIWAKSHITIGRGHYQWQHEPCWYAVRVGATGHWIGDRKQTTVWQIDKPQKSETGHSTQKPVECMRRPIENNSAPGDAVYDPFLGSGTTIIACEQTGRACVAVEISPQYTDVAIRRWQLFSGGTAIHEPTGRPFAAIAAERAGA